jgi:hypothetical protein
MAEKVKMEDLKPGARAITFNIGGLYGYEGKEGARKGENYLDYKLKTEILGDKDNPGGDHHVIQHRNMMFNSTMPVTTGTPLEHVESTIQHYATILKPVLISGRNPEAVKLAAKAIAYHKKHPELPINFIGHSAGGMIANEAHEILRTQGIKTNVVSLAAGHFGITPERPGAVHTIYRDDDMYLATIPGGVRGGVRVKTGKGLNPDSHRVRAYMNDEGVREQIRSLVKIKARKKRPQKKRTKSKLGVGFG